METSRLGKQKKETLRPHTTRVLLHVLQERDTVFTHYFFLFGRHKINRNILLTPEGNVKLGGSGSIMNHKEGAGERKRRRRSMTMVEIPASWLAPESNLSASSSSPVTPPNDPFSLGSTSMTRSLSMPSITDGERAVPEASTETDIWALGVACIELSQGRAPGPDTPILASFGAHKGKPSLGSNSPLAMSRVGGENSPIQNITWSNYGQVIVGATAAAASQFNNNEIYGPAGMGMSEDMWCFISRCLTPEPEARPTVRELLKVLFFLCASTNFESRHEEGRGVHGSYKRFFFSVGPIH